MNAQVLLLDVCVDVTNTIRVSVQTFTDPCDVLIPFIPAAICNTGIISPNAPKAQLHEKYMTKLKHYLGSV
jgi:hypothetical protein